jgi:hypothetical protein
VYGQTFGLPFFRKRFSFSCPAHACIYVCLNVFRSGQCTCCLIPCNELYRELCWWPTDQPTQNWCIMQQSGNRLCRHAGRASSRSNLSLSNTKAAEAWHHTLEQGISLLVNVGSQVACPGSLNRRTVSPPRLEPGDAPGH